VVDVATGTIVKLDDSSETNGSGVAFPAGSNLYWVHQDATGSRVRAGLLDGSMVHDIVSVTHGESTGLLNLQPSTSGDFVLVQDSDVLGAYGFANNAAAPIATGVQSVMPLGTAGAYLVNRNDAQTLTTVVERVTVSTVAGAAQVTAPTPVVSGPGGNFFFIVTSVDKTLVAYSGTTDGGPEVVVTAATGTPTAVSNAPVSSNFGFVGETHTLYFSSGSTIGLADIASDGSVGATRGVSGGSVQTPTRGHLLAYVDATGNNVLTDDQLASPFVVPFPSASFNFSPDGTRALIYNSGQSALLATPPAAPVSTGLDVNSVYWSSDQKHLVLQDATSGQFTVTDSTFTVHTPLPDAYCVSPFSPTGKRFSFRTRQSTGRFLISIFDTDASTSLAVLGHSDSSCGGGTLDAWLAGDKLVAARANESGEVYRFVAGPYVLSGP
jgi:hypothetical protein